MDPEAEPPEVTMTFNPHLKLRVLQCVLFKLLISDSEQPLQGAIDTLSLSAIQSELMNAYIFPGNGCAYLIAEKLPLACELFLPP